MLGTSTLTTIKLISYPIVGTAIYLNLPAEPLNILAILLLLDIITGLIREWVIDKRNISSRIGYIGFISKMLTFLIPFVFAFVFKGIGFDVKIFAETIISVLIVYEGWSVISNIGQIRAGDKTINEYDAISYLIKTIQDIFRGLLEKSIYK